MKIPNTKRFVTLMVIVSVIACSSTSDGNGHDDTIDSGTDIQLDSIAQDDVDDSELTGRLETVGNHSVLYLWGTPHEMGYAEGSLMCSSIRALAEDFVLGTMVAYSGIDYEELTDEVMAITDLTDDEEAQLRGMIEGGQDNCADEFILESPHLEDEANGRRAPRYEDLVVANTLADWACSSFTLWGEATATGELIHARNLDYSYDAEGTLQRVQVIKVIQSDNEGGARWVNIGWPGLIGCVSCITSEGVGLMMHDSGGLSSTQETGFVPRQIALRRALIATNGQSDPVSAAENALESYPQYRGNNFHLFVSGGDEPTAVVFEYDGNQTHDDGQATVRAPGDPENGFATTDAMACTNHYRSRRAPSSCSRYSTLVGGISEAATTGGYDAESAHTLIDAVAVSGTLHTIIFDASDGSLRVYIGEEPGRPATEFTPSVFDFDDLFDGLPQ